MAVLAPMPNARVTTAAAAKPGARERERKACFRSRSRASMRIGDSVGGMGEGGRGTNRATSAVHPPSPSPPCVSSGELARRRTRRRRRRGPLALVQTERRPVLGHGAHAVAALLQHHPEAVVRNRVRRVARAGRALEVRTKRLFGAVEPAPGERPGAADLEERVHFLRVLPDHPLELLERLLVLRGLLIQEPEAVVQVQLVRVVAEAGDVRALGLRPPVLALEQLAHSHGALVRVGTRGPAGRRASVRARRRHRPRRHGGTLAKRRTRSRDGDQRGGSNARDARSADGASSREAHVGEGRARFTRRTTACAHPLGRTQVRHPHREGPCRSCEKFKSLRVNDLPCVTPIPRTVSLPGRGMPRPRTGRPSGVRFWDCWAARPPSNPLHQSFLSASTGFTRVARRAGMYEARVAIAASTRAMAPNVTGSVALTSNSIPLMRRVSARAPPRPSAIPTAASPAPCRTTSASTSRGEAPSAIRMPSSCVRWATE